MSSTVTSHSPNTSVATSSRSAHLTSNCLFANFEIDIPIDIILFFKLPVSMCPICETIKGESVQLQNLLETSVSKLKSLMDSLKLKIVGPIVLQ